MKPLHLSLTFFLLSLGIKDATAAPPIATGERDGYFSLRPPSWNSSPKPEENPPLPESIPDLQALFHNRQADPVLRIQAARTLIDQGSPESPESLKAMLESIPDYFKAQSAHFLLSAYRASLPFGIPAVPFSFEEAVKLGDVLSKININPPSEEKP